MRRAALHAALALLVGLVHAAVVVVVAAQYGWDFGPIIANRALPPSTLVWRYGGLVLLGAVPAWLALSDRLVSPLLVVAVLAGYAIGMEITPPDPTFMDVAEIEPGIDEPTGHTVVQDGLYVIKYTEAWYVWFVGAVLAGLWEHVARARSGRVPDPGGWSRLSGISRITSREGAVRIALAAGGLHAAASLGYATGWGIAGSIPLFVWGLVGGVALLAVPTYLLVRYGLVWPLPVAIVLFLNSVHSQAYVAGPGDPHALYVGAWFFFLGLPLLVAGGEFGARKFLGSLGA